MLNERRDISGSLSLWVVICFTIIALVCATIFASMEYGSYISQLFIYLIAVVGAVILSKSKGVDYFQISSIKNKINFQSAIYVMAMGLGLLYFGSFFANTVYYGLELVGYTPIDSDISVTNVTELVVNLIFVGMLPALCEEFLIRGGVFASMNKTRKCTVAILLSAFFFAVLHANMLVSDCFGSLLGEICGIVAVFALSVMRKKSKEEQEVLNRLTYCEPSQVGIILKEYFNLKRKNKK